MQLLPHILLALRVATDVQRAVVRQGEAHAAGYRPPGRPLRQPQGPLGETSPVTGARPDPSTYPLISYRGKTGDRMVGERGPLAVELYASGTPPMHGFAAKRPVADRVAQVRLGDELSVERRGDEWVALDDEGVVGTLRWLAVHDGRPDVNGVVIRFPTRGVLLEGRIRSASLTSRRNGISPAPSRLACRVCIETTSGRGHPSPKPDLLHK